MIAYCPKKDAFLFGKRSETVKKPGHWDFFGGHIDQNESPLDSVTREFEEESGLKLNHKSIIKIDHQKILDLAYVHSIREMHYFLIFVEDKIKIHVNHEHSDYCWFPSDAIPRKVNRPTEIGISIGVLKKTLLLATSHGLK